MSITAPYTVAIVVTGHSWTEPYFRLDHARRAVSIWADKSDFIGATIRTHAGKVVA
jgi:hypothetical protein